MAPSLSRSLRSSPSLIATFTSQTQLIGAAQASRRLIRTPSIGLLLGRVPVYRSGAFPAPVSRVRAASYSCLVNTHVSG